ncbi:MAG TPA: TonB-dependent receptor [Candidatus Acidoferrum sp.]|nr:TonB-dependent receptor [Candidatus Acidoferrum sp.]
MRKHVRRFGLSLFAAALLALVPTARATIFSIIRGIVHDPQHRPIAGVEVTLKSSTSAWSQTVQTDPSGEFHFDAVAIGEYSIAIHHPGFRDVSQNLVVASGSSPLLHFELKIASATQSVEVSAEEQPQEIDTASSTSQTLVTRSDIQSSPGATRTNSLAMITNFVPGAYVVHDQLHIRGGHQVSWLVDGVPVPNTSIASNVGPQFDPKDVDYLEVQRGGYTADYGDRMFGVFNVVPRTGFDRNNDVDILATYGSYNQTNSQIDLGGHTQRFAYYASVNANRSDATLETPVPQIIHDLGDGVGGFGSLIYNATPNDQLRLVTSIRHDFYQVPNTPEQQSICPQPVPPEPNCSLRDVDNETDSFVNFSWVRTLSPGAVLTVSPFYHYNSANLTPGPDDTPTITFDNRASNYVGLQSSISLVNNKNNFRGGLYVYGEHDNFLFSVTPNDENGLGPTTSQRQLVWGNLQAIFLEDQYRPTSWLSLNGGVRLTHFDGLANENSADPRIGTAIRIPKVNAVLRGFYGRYYQAPPLDTISGPLLGPDFGFLPLHGERDEHWEVGLAVPFRGWTFDEVYFHTAARNFLDHDVLGNSNIFLPLTIDHARIYGWETTVRSPELFHRARVHLAYSHQYAEGAGGVTGGLTDFTPPDTGYFFLDHDQRDTLSTGYDLTLPWAMWTSGNLNFGSGFLNGDGPQHLPSHTTFDFSIGKNIRERLSISFTAINVSDNRYLLDTSNTFGGTHYVEPRQFIGSIRWRFHY